MTPTAIHVHDYRIAPGTVLEHAKLGRVTVTHITPGHDGDPRLELQPAGTDAREWFILTHSGLRAAWGDTITPTTDPTPTPTHDRIRNQPRADGGRVVDDDHDCIPQTNQTTDTERCRLCGQLLDQ